jgi:hypothetical protein
MGGLHFRAAAPTAASDYVQGTDFPWRKFLCAAGQG